MLIASYMQEMAIYAGRSLGRELGIVLRITK
jgi:hypothetical protein